MRKGANQNPSVTQVHAVLPHAQLPLASNFCMACSVPIINGESLRHDDGAYIWVCKDCGDYPFVTMDGFSTADPWALKNEVVHSLTKFGYSWDDAVGQLGDGVIVKGIPYLVKFKDPDGDRALPNVCPKCGERGSPQTTVSYNPSHTAYQSLRYVHWVRGNGEKKGSLRWCQVASLGRAPQKPPHK